jgi:hypothetical protein
VFERVFEKTGHIAHYRMMMRISDEGEPAEGEAIPAAAEAAPPPQGTPASAPAA